MKKSFTLIEIIIVLVISAFILLATTSFVVFFLNGVRLNADRYNMYSQVNYALEDIKLRCLGAVNIDQPFREGDPFRGSFPNREWVRDNLAFVGEDDPYIIDDRNHTMTSAGGTKVWYRYCVADLVNCVSNAAVGSLVLLRSTGGTFNAPGVYNLYETLVDPGVNETGNVRPVEAEFMYSEGDDPNFITAAVNTTGTVPNGEVYETMEGILFKYMEIRL
ncbi:MAG: prepilin-type N-terminal cleavage/methylation domain-containing protein [Omnitrophica bacterium]|nr:prepilin-type N-terminal cleavage/methylation domain-containing protein [Candidatus Omnitrophota bacterium]